MECYSVEAVGNESSLIDVGFTRDSSKQMAAERQTPTLTLSLRLCVLGSPSLIHLLSLSLSLSLSVLFSQSLFLSVFISVHIFFSSVILPLPLFFFCQTLSFFGQSCSFCFSPLPFKMGLLAILQRPVMSSHAFSSTEDLCRVSSHDLHLL